MFKTFKNMILISFASLLLVACSQQGGDGSSKKSKTLETRKSHFVNVEFHNVYQDFKC